MFRTRSRSFTRRAVGVARRAARPWVESLEDRCVPAGTLTGVPFTSLNPQPVEGSPFTGQIATVFDTGPMTPALTISINWGDGTATDTTTGMATATGATTGPGAAAFSISGTHTYAEESGSTTPPFNFTVTVTVRDTANGIGPLAISSQAAVLDANLSQGNPVTATPSQRFSGTGGTNTSTTAGSANAALTAFEAAVGGMKNTAPAPQNGGFRTITWDGVKTDGTDAAAGPNSTVVIPPLGGGATHTVGIPLNRFEGSGVYFGAVYGVSSDNFIDVNPTVTGLFPPFSMPSTFAMFNDNGIDFKFVVPSTTNSTIVSASSRGFGAIFINVEQANMTSIQYFNGNNLLDTEFAPVGGKGQPVFVGALFNNPVVTRVLLTLGTDVIFKFDGTNVTAGATDSGTATGTNLVVTDDWAFAEPVPTANGLPIVTGAQGTANATVTVNPTAGVSFTGVVATFSDQDPNGNAKDFTATINWGDGHSTNGTITKNAQGGFNVAGTNLYARPGLFPINVDVADFGGGNGIGGSLPTVSINNTANVTAAAQTIGAYDPSTSTFFLRNENSPGGPDAGTIKFGTPGFLPVVGDWNGDGIDTIGVFDPATGTWFLRNENSPGTPDAGQFQYGAPGTIPVVGDWMGLGHDGIGVFDPKTGMWFLRNEVSAGPPDAGQFAFGLAGFLPVTGNWTGVGHDGIGVFDPTTGLWQVRTEVSAGGPDAGIFLYGGTGSKPVTGDWMGVGHTGVGVFTQSTATFQLRAEVSGGAPDVATFAFGPGGSLPVAGTYSLPGHLLLTAATQADRGSTLSTGDLEATVQAALGRLSAAGVDPSVVGLLASADYELAALPAGLLGSTDVLGRRVTLSVNAVGQGWYVDPTPLQDEEYTSNGPGAPLVAPGGSPAAGKIDLLTAVLHEMGHLVGQPDVSVLDNPAALMAGSLAPGERHLGALNQVFAGGERG
jgi:hypothetical protein